MKPRRTLLAGLMVAAAALVGCTAEDATENEAAKHHAEQQQDMNQALKDGEVHETDPVPAPSETQSPEHETPTWADKQLDEFLATAGANSLEAWPEGSPERNIKDVNSPDDGVMRFIVSEGDYSEDELESLAFDYMSRVGCVADDVDEVVVETRTGDESVSRDQCG